MADLGGGKLAALADPTEGALRVCAPRSIFFLFYVPQKFCHIIAWHPYLWGWHTPFWEILDPLDLLRDPRPKMFSCCRLGHCHLSRNLSAPLFWTICPSVPSWQAIPIWQRPLAKKLTAKEASE